MYSFDWELPEKKPELGNDGVNGEIELVEAIDNQQVGPVCEKSFKVYKTCYLLNDMFNEIFAPAAMPGLKYLTLLLTIFPLFGFIRFHASMDLLTSYQVLILIPAAGLSLIPGALVMSACYNISTEFPKNMPFKILNETNEGTLHRKLYLAQVKSILPVRCKVGSLYYMERQAKLTLLDTLVNSLVFLLLNF